MEDELPDNQVYRDEPEPLESPARVETQDFGQTPVPAQEMNAPYEADADGTIESKMQQEPDAFPESGLSVVDPYTATPPARGMPVPSFGHDLPDGNTSWQDPVTPDDPFIPLPYSPTPAGESIRRSGLAWSAGIAFFGSVAFTLFLGWIVDLLLGIFPWGIVGGIVFGSIIGFLQFFRITSRIFPSKDDGPEVTPLLSRREDE